MLSAIQELYISMSLSTYMLSLSLDAAMISRLDCYVGEILDKFEIKTNVENNGQSILPDIRNAIYSYLEEKGINKNDVLGIGFGIQGPVVKNVVYKCANLGWDVLNIQIIRLESCYRGY